MIQKKKIMITAKRQPEIGCLFFSNKNEREREVIMNNITYTTQELQTLKFYELPNTIYNRILSDLRKQFGVLTEKMIITFNNAPVYQLDQYVNIYKYILVI